MKSAETLQYDSDFLNFCHKAIQKDFSSLSIKDFLIAFIDDLSKKPINSLLSPIKRSAFLLI